ncbi:MAG: hypothetical protein ACYC8T_26940 [Myxococcaceae bacterium]
MPTRRSFLFVIAVLLLAFGYAVVRYVVLGQTPPAHIPMYVTNKALAVTALALIGMAFASKTPEGRRQAGLAALLVGALHSVLTLALLGPGYFAKLYQSADGSGGFTVLGEAGLLAGAVALVLAVTLALPADMGPQPSWRRPVAFGIAALVGVHCLALGWAGWWSPAAWPGGMPPITLLSFLAALAVPLRGRR